MKIHCEHALRVFSFFRFIAILRIAYIEHTLHQHLLFAPKLANELAK